MLPPAQGHRNLGPDAARGCPDAGLPRPRPVEKQRKMTMRMSSPSCTQILFMIRIICSVSMSCRRSSPHCEPAGKSHQSQGAAGAKLSQPQVDWGSRAGGLGIARRMGSP